MFHYIRRSCIGIFLYNANRQAQIHRLRSRYGTITDQTACTLIDQQNLLLLQQMQTYCRNQTAHSIIRVNTSCSITAVIKKISRFLD